MGELEQTAKENERMKWEKHISERVLKKMNLHE